MVLMNWMYSIGIVDLDVAGMVCVSLFCWLAWELLERIGAFSALAEKGKNLSAKINKGEAVLFV